MIEIKLTNFIKIESRAFRMIGIIIHEISIQVGFFSQLFVRWTRPSFLFFFLRHSEAEFGSTSFLKPPPPPASLFPPELFSEGSARPERGAVEAKLQVPHIYNNNNIITYHDVVVVVVVTDGPALALPNGKKPKNYRNRKAKSGVCPAGKHLNAYLDDFCCCALYKKPACVACDLLCFHPSAFANIVTRNFFWSHLWAHFGNIFGISFLLLLLTLGLVLLLSIERRSFTRLSLQAALLLLLYPFSPKKNQMHIRPATPSDFSSTASISVPCFWNDELYDYTNPWRERYPDHFRASFLRRHKLRFVTPGYVFHVAVTDAGDQGHEGEGVVVGFAVWERRGTSEAARGWRRDGYWNCRILRQWTRVRGSSLINRGT